MSYKKIAGLVALVIALVLLGYGIYGSFQMAEANRDIESKTRYFPEEAVRDVVREELYGRVDKHKVPVSLCYVGSAIFLIGGIILLCHGSKKK